MKTDTSRRNFLAAGLALPAAGLASATSSPTPSALAPQQAAPASGKVTYRVLGKTGMKVTTVGYGCMITSDPTVIQRAVDMGINYFDTSRNYQGGQNERMVGAALGARRKDIFLSSKSDDDPRPAPESWRNRYQPQGAQHRPPGRVAAPRQGHRGADHRRTGGGAAQGQTAGQGAVHRHEHARAADRRRSRHRSQAGGRPGAVQLHLRRRSGVRPSRSCSRPASAWWP